MNFGESDLLNLAQNAMLLRPLRTAKSYSRNLLRWAIETRRPIRPERLRTTTCVVLRLSSQFAVRMGNQLFRFGARSESTSAPL